MTTASPAPQHSEDTPVILGIAFPYAVVGPCAVGGAEVILSQIEAALPDLGFRSAVVAHADSRPQGPLYPTPIPPGPITDAVRNQVERAHHANIDRALAENPVALVHMHGLDFHRYTIPGHIPVVVTLHLPPSWYPDAVWHLPPNFHLVCVSETQRQACPPEHRARITVINNGVPLPDPTHLRPDGRYALMLARICAEKNLHRGLDAACIANMPAILAGETFPYEAHLRYFHEEIEPRLSAAGQQHQPRCETQAPAPSARFIGAVAGPAKTKLLARAACLLVPSLAPETSSLVAMEALAAGVPVIAVASGAVPEIITPGRTGFLIEPSDNVAPAMAAAIQRLHELDRSICRAEAESRFDIPRMLTAYAALYRELARTPQPAAPHAFIEQAQLGNAPPVVELIRDPQHLEAIREEWAHLWQQDTQATPFQHPAWLLPWWHAYSANGHLAAVSLRSEQGDLLGLVPAYIYTQPSTGDHQLLFVGTATSDYQNGLFHPLANPAQLATTALNCLLDQPGWHTLSLPQLPQVSPLLTAAKARNLAITPADPCSSIHLDRHLPSKIRANVRRYRRHAEAQGTLHLALASTPDEALATFNELVDLHRERWHQRGEAGVLSDLGVLAHHREAIPQLLAAGLLRLFRLTLNDDVLGVLYALADPPRRPTRTLFLYLMGINTQFAELSPGSLLLSDVCDYARFNGFTQLDLLRGGEQYKQLWGADPSPTFAIQAVHPIEAIRDHAVT